MGDASPPHDPARVDAAELAELRARLAEAEETLRAIRTGEVDAFVIDGKRGERVYTVEGAERPYSLLVEAMSEGAAIILADGTILFTNGRLAEMASVPRERILGKPFQALLAEGSIATFEALVRRATEGRATGEVQLRAGEREAPVLLSIRSMEDANVPSLSLVATDLTEQKRNDEMVAQEKLARSILDQAADGIVVCDPQGRILRASVGAHRLCGQNPLLRRFADVFRLHPTVELERGGPVQGVEAQLRRDDGKELDLLVSAAPLHGASGERLGQVYTLTDLTERRRVERERDRLLVREREARREAEAASRAKDEFVAVLSHELRTPLTALLSWLTLLQQGKLAEPERARALATIERSARAQAQMIEDLLDASRIATNKLHLDRAPVDLAAV
ncbi:MAG TPA: PAS domain S-box protein, partial [Planctomycetota bacterium]|nr:PAS domain S-box protein [Planctomycetota bacterium]